MIAALSGNVLFTGTENLILDVSGVGYEIFPTSTVIQNAKKEGQKLSILVFTDVKENAISLFGFSNSLEKEVFLLLKKVKGIGSRTALNVISHIGPEKLLQSIGSADLETITKVPGIGRKTAERLFVELKESVTQYVKDVIHSSASSTSTSFEMLAREKYRDLPPVAGDAILALEKLGFSGEKAKQAVSLALANSSLVTLGDPGEVVRTALAHL